MTSPITVDPERDAELAEMEARQREAGISTTETEYVDYFGFDERHRFSFPDGKQWIEIKELNEGELSKFQSKSSRDVVVSRNTGDARMKMDQAGDRHTLIEVSVTDWHVVRRSVKTSKEWHQVAFSTTELRQFLELAPAKLISDLESFIQKHNPMLSGDMTLEEIDREIENLNKRREEMVNSQAEKASS